GRKHVVQNRRKVRGNRLINQSIVNDDVGSGGVIGERINREAARNAQEGEFKPAAFVLILRRGVHAHILIKDARSIINILAQILTTRLDADAGSFTGKSNSQAEVG